MLATRPSRFAAAMLFVSLFLSIPAMAATTLSIDPPPVSWNIIGLDSNSPATGPHLFPVGTRVCSSVATTNVSVSMFFDSANSFVDFRAGSLSTITIPVIGAGQCKDAFFEIDVTQTAAAFDTTRRYHITATDGSGSVSTPLARELYVEHLISQNRNSVTDVKYGPLGCGGTNTCTSVAAGGSMNLVVGSSYDIQLLGGTATQGYNQFEAFIGFPNTIFQIQSVATTYSADNSPYVPGPAPTVNNKLYADACLWENDFNSPAYRSCVGGDFKAGGNSVVTTYSIKIVSGGGTSQTLGSLLYDFSGSSYHYNADFGVGARIANVINPTAATISKAFSPNPTGINGISALKITLGNPNAAAVSGYNFVDNLPANLVVATPPGASTAGCGTPTLTAVAGSSSISFSNGTVAANGNCVISVNVTPTATGSLVNTTNNLFIDIDDTTHNATATLTVNNAPPPGTGFCGTTLALWDFPTGFNINAPVATTANVPATAAPGPGVTPKDTTHDSTINPGGGSSWGSNGNIAGPNPTLDTTQNDYFEFSINTTGISSVSFSFDAEHRGGQGPTGIAAFYGTAAGNPETGTSLLNNNNGLPTQNNWVHFGPFNINSGLNPSGPTFFRIYGFNAGNQTSGSDFEIDHVLLTGCTTAVKPTITKAFAPNSVAVNGVSTLTFTLTNTNGAPLTGATFTDSLPAGLEVAAAPAQSTTCGGGPTWAPAAAATTLTFGAPTGGTIPANGSCTASVNVKATTAGPHANTSGFLVTTEAGTNTSSVASASLSAVLPPSITKMFAPSPILAGGISRLTFTITNPNPNDAVSGVNFGDTFPTSPGAMVVAGTPSQSTSGCGAPTFNPVGGAASITFSGGAIAAGGTCTVALNVTAPATGTYNNTSSPVSHIINAQTVNGNTAMASLVVNPPHPSIGLLKQVASPNPGPPWHSFVAIASGSDVYYQFTVENTGDVPLTLGATTLTDNNVDVSTCNAGFSGTILPVAVPANDNHIVTCVVGPVASTPGSHTNTASATATFSGNPVNSPNDSATYATTGLTLVKSATETSFTNSGDTLHYSYLVTNSGFAPLQGPVTVSDDHTTVTCPAVSTVGDLDNFLDPGESITCTATYTVTGTDVASFQVTNTATASADGVTSNSSSKMVPLSTSADVSIDKSLTTSAPFLTGGTVNYTLTVANGGPSTATNIQVTDMPTNLTITNVTGSGCAALPCTIASLASGANTQIFVTATTNAAGAFDNSASVTATQPDPNLGNNTDNTGNGGTAVNSADVSITKTLDTAGPYVNGESIQYTIVVANAGPSTATNVQVTDTPTHMNITNVSGGGCSAFPCTIASLASGANVTITVTATITSTGIFDNSASVTATESDPVPSNNTDNTNNFGGASNTADLQVTKTLNTAGPFVAGQSITYTISVHNAGPDAALLVSINDTPTNLTITNVTGSGCSAFPCTPSPPNLSATLTDTVTVTATINAVGAFDNSATASSNSHDPDLSNNTDNTGNGGTAVDSADVSITKTLDTAGPYFNGGSIQYTIVVANAGPATATNVQVTDTPTHLNITNVSGGGCSAFPCTIASLASGANVTITVTATITSTGIFDNSASVTATEFDPNTANNIDNTNNFGGASNTADLQVTKTLNTAGPFVVGQSITYTISVHNAGPDAALIVSINDTPTNLTITNVTGSGCSAFPCTPSPPNLSGTLTDTVTVTATINAAGSFDNSATATSNSHDPNPSNNTDNTGNGGTAAASADVSMVKTLVTAGPYTVGQSVTYTLVVNNAGPSTATNIQVTDVPSNLTITNVTGSGCAALPCTIASLSSNTNTTITVTATIVTGGAFDNSATATGTESDPVPSNNTDNTGNAGSTAMADISIVKTLVTTGPYYAGQSVSYTLVIHNAGPSTATGIQVTDTPTNQTITGVSGSGCSALPCTIPSLAINASTTINITATITAAGTFTNSATATPIEFDPNMSDNTGAAGNGGLALASADIDLVKTLLTAGPFSAGQSISYTLVVHNAGPSPATSIQVTDTPTNLSITSVTGSGCAALPCTIASLAVNASTTINVTATIIASGVFDNSATATPAENDPTPANNTDAVGNGGVTGGGSADMMITKTASTAVVVPGQTFDYTLVVVNNGPATATNVVVTDTLPAAFSLISATSTQGTCSGTTTVTCTVGTMLNGASVTITLHGTAASNGSLSNTATVSATETDPAPANNSSTINLQFVAGGPTLSTLGLILMGLLLAIAGAMFIRIGD
jgi:uncharacterized repeat protein (TIGR01451 family)